MCVQFGARLSYWRAWDALYAKFTLTMFTCTQIMQLFFALIPKKTSHSNIIPIYMQPCACSGYHNLLKQCVQTFLWLLSTTALMLLSSCTLVTPAATLFQLLRNNLLRVLLIRESRAAVEGESGPERV